MRTLRVKNHRNSVEPDPQPSINEDTENGISSNETPAIDAIPLKAKAKRRRGTTAVSTNLLTTDTTVLTSHVDETHGMAVSPRLYPR